MSIGTMDGKVLHIERILYDRIESYLLRKVVVVSDERENMLLSIYSLLISMRSLLNNALTHHTGYDLQTKLDCLFGTLPITKRRIKFDDVG